MSGSSAASKAPKNTGKTPLRVETQDLPSAVPRNEGRLKTEQNEPFPSEELLSDLGDSAAWSDNTEGTSALANLVPQPYSANLTDQELNFWQVEEHMAPLATRRSRELVIMASGGRHGQTPPTAKMLEEAGYTGFDLEMAAGIAKELIALRSHRIGFVSANLPCSPEVVSKAEEIYRRIYHAASVGNPSLLNVEGAEACQKFAEILEDLRETNVWVRVVSSAVRAQRAAAGAAPEAATSATSGVVSDD